jgi:RES domain-containing protein
VAGIPDSLPIQTVETSVLSGNWRRFSPYFSITQTLGMRWLTDMKSAVLKVPSAISEAEWNFLLNPAHADFQKLRIGNAIPFMMDPRVP